MTIINVQVHSVQHSRCMTLLFENVQAKEKPDVRATSVYYKRLTDVADESKPTVWESLALVVVA